MVLLSGRRLRAAAFGLIVVSSSVVLDGCSRHVRQDDGPSGPAAIEELWQAPANITERDLFHGPGGPTIAPRDTAFAFIAEDGPGFSPGYDVRDGAGVEWSVKLGPESQTEVVTSRLLWAIGFHQPPAYFLSRWTLTGGKGGEQAAGRFRPTLPHLRNAGMWSWYENPFAGTRPFGGLIVANLLLNNWDWKADNNTIYAHAEPVNGVRRWFVVRDVGASLGKTTYPVVLKWVKLRGFGQGTRNDLAGFESQGFITRVRDDKHLEFDYAGMYGDVIDTVTTDDVRWTCELFAQLADKQWADAFRAGGFSDEQTARYVRKIKEKIGQGLALPKQ